MYYYNKYLEPLSWLLNEFKVKDWQYFFDKLPDCAISKEYELIKNKQSNLSSVQRKYIEKLYKDRKL